MSRTTKTNLIVASVLLLLALGAFVVALYMVGAGEKELMAQMETLAKDRQQENLYFETQKVFDNSTENRANLTKHLLTEEGQSIEVLTWIEELAPRAKVNLETKNLIKVTDKETQTDWVEVTFAFSGTQADVEKFVAILEHLPYTSHVTSLQMSARSSSNWEAVTTLRILLFKTP